jgi:chromosome segregation ATPase
MKKVILKSLSLSEWKAKNIFVQFDEHSTKISGENQVGKSSLIHAFTWLLTSRTEPNANANSEIFDNRIPITPDTPTASVTAVVSIDGYDYEIKRTAKAKFTRPRGSSEWVKASSDEYHTYIDNIEYSATDFTNWLNANICNIDHLIYAIDGSFFTYLCEDDKGKARKVLEGIVGDITIADFKGDYSAIVGKLGRYSIENIEEQAKAEIKPLNKRLEEIPALIADKERTLTEYEGIDYNALLAEIESKKGEIERIDAEILGNATAYAPIIEERNAILQKISDLNMTIDREKREYRQAFDDSIAEISDEIAKTKRKNVSIMSENANAEAQLNALHTRLKSVKQSIDFYEGKIMGLRIRRDELKAKTFDENTTCTFCGQKLPDAIIDDLLTKFNEARVKELEAIANEGKKCRELLDNYQNDAKELDKEIEKGVVKKELLDISGLEKTLKEKSSAFVPFENTARYYEIKDAVDKLTGDMPELPQSSSVELTHKKREIIDELHILNRRYGLKEKADLIRSDINELNQERRSVACDIAQLEGVLAKCKEYIEERADIISNRVNDKLNGCRIVMYSEQKDGNVKPDCVITDVEGVKYSTLSNSARLRANLQISRLFRAHHDVELPYFVDEAGCFDSKNLPTFGNAQSVYLYADDYKILQVEYE